MCTVLHNYIHFDRLQDQALRGLRSNDLKTGQVLDGIECKRFKNLVVKR